MKLAYISLPIAAAAFLIPPGAVEPLARVVVPAIALMAAGVFPCMTLVVNAMKGEHRTPALIEDLYGNLRRLLRLLVATFALAVLAMVLLAAAVVLLHPPVLPRIPELPIVPKLTVCAAAFVIGLLIGRVEAIGRAFFALLDINRKHALLIARAKVRGERDEAIEASKLARVPEDDPTPRPLQRVG